MNCKNDLCCFFLSQAKIEWEGVQDVVLLSFKAACHVIKAQSECIKEMEQILPAKANKQDVNQQLAQKANLFDIKSTMTEVAKNIESKVSLEGFQTALDQKFSALRIQETLQEKVSYDDMKRYVTLHHGGGGSDQAAQLSNGGDTSSRQ